MNLSAFILGIWVTHAMLTYAMAICLEIILQIRWTLCQTCHLNSSMREHAFLTNMHSLSRLLLLSPWCSVSILHTRFQQVTIKCWKVLQTCNQILSFFEFPDTVAHFLCFVLFSSLDVSDDAFKVPTLYCLRALLMSCFFSSVWRIWARLGSYNYCENLIALASSLPVVNDISSVGGNSLDTES